MLNFRFPTLFSLPGLVSAALTAGTAGEVAANPGFPAGHHAETPAVPDYIREVQPVLSEHCFACHGPDAKARKADLRLDDRSAALAAGVLKPGDPQASELIRHLAPADPEDLMPPPSYKKPMTPEEIGLLRRWVAGGAPYAEHWAFKTPVKPEVPVPPASQPEKARVKDPVDAFLADRLRRGGLFFSPEAPREVWLRRVTFDLTGLPPSLAEQDAFLTDPAPDAFEKVVDRLLASPAYGERMAADWLDTARYGDTYGRHEDADCATWPYRDWVIRAFNQNLPWDQFITWQTAGDLLPRPTRDQMIATAFNRLPPQSNEAGSNPEEFRLEQVADRVKTNGLAFMGLTTECARCHDHKFDPISTRDFYSLSAFFNNIDEMGLFCVYTGATPPPSILLFTPEQEARHQAARAEIAAAGERLEKARPAAEARFAEWLKINRPPRGEPWVTAHTAPEGRAVATGGAAGQAAGPRAPLSWHQFESAKSKVLPDSRQPKIPGKTRINADTAPGRVGNSLVLANDNTAYIMAVPELRRTDRFSYALWVNPARVQPRAVLAHRSRAGLDAASRGVELILEDGKPSFALCHFSPGNEIRIRAKTAVPLNRWTHLAVTYDGSSRAAGLAVYGNGERLETEVVRDCLYRDIVYRADWGDDTDKDDGSLAFFLGGRTNDACYTDRVDEFQFFDCTLTAPEVRQIALQPDSSRPADWLEWYLREIDEETRALNRELDAARVKENELSGGAVDLMVMKEWTGARRPAHVLARGEFNQPGEEVRPGVPEAILPFDPSWPQNRLGFARWLTDPRHPLTARVAVNRFWQLFFNRGLVPTQEDFGTQGQPPSHPELLDWLAVDFRENGWDVKALCRRLVLSTAYRQSGAVTPELLEKDPENQLLARGPRARLTGEALRDMALSVSGLLVPETGGPSVYPYQPAGLWEESGTQHAYHQGKGSDLHRRSLYSFWRRTLPPPTLTTFDAPTREFCKVRRQHTTTPLQALLLMNDPQFLEAARILAEKLVRRHPADDTARARDAFRLLTSRAPDEKQLAVLTGYLAKERPLISPQEAGKFLTTTGEVASDPTLPPAEVTATTRMIRLLFGFQETMMKP